MDHQPSILEEQLSGLSPRARLVAGALLVPGAVLLAAALWDRGLIWGFSWFLLLLGLALAGSGMREEARRRRFDAEVARARGEWAELQRELALCKRTHGNPARLLQQRGYREFAVRRWIVRELVG
jgi:hypothetical protein